MNKLRYYTKTSKTKVMEPLKMIFSLALIGIICCTMSCNTMKDCGGRKKHKTSNGIWMKHVPAQTVDGIQS